MEAPLTRLVLDSVLLAVILFAVLREDAPEWPKLAVICLAVALSNAVWMWLVHPWIKWFAIVPLLIAAGLILRLTLPITTRRTGLVLLLFFVAHVAITLIEAFFP